MNLKTIILCVLSILITFGQASAKEYEIPNIKVEVSINEDGTVRITEHLTYVFDGSFSWAEYELPKEGYSAIKNIQVSENGQSFINENSETAGTFSIAKNENAVKIRWYYQAVDENRTFTISYTRKMP